MYVVLTAASLPPPGIYFTIEGREHNWLPLLTSMLLNSQVKMEILICGSSLAQPHAFITMFGQRADCPNSHLILRSNSGKL